MRQLNAAGRPLSFYIHVPYCSTRCGYCDFNTYTVEEFEPGFGRGSWLAAAELELEIARESLTGAPAAQTVFFGGGTPTLLPAAHLARALEAVGESFGLAAGGEVTTEANPDSVDTAYLRELRAAGFTRVAFGMQSTSARVLRLLDRTHTPGTALQAVAWAQAAGFEHINLDVIYGTPGETMAELRQTLTDAIATGVDHVSAYSLTIEPGTRLGAMNARGDFPSTDEDELAAKYELVDELLTSAGFEWYEISNWARPGGQCQHNLHYWRNDNWWGVGPGAHSHVAGVRFWNEKHPVTWQQSVQSGRPPWAGSEELDASAQELERVLLGVRLREGLPLAGFAQATLEQLAAEHLVDGEKLASGRLVLTRRGRLLADYVVRALTD